MEARSDKFSLTQCGHPEEIGDHQETTREGGEGSRTSIDKYMVIL